MCVQVGVVTSFDTPRYVLHPLARAHTQVKGYINRIMVEFSFNPKPGSRGVGGPGAEGGQSLGRDRRDRLCGFIERLEKARFCAPAH